MDVAPTQRCPEEYCGALPGFRARLYGKLVKAVALAFESQGVKSWSFLVEAEEGDSFRATSLRPGEISLSSEALRRPSWEALCTGAGESLKIRFPPQAALPFRSRFVFSCVAEARPLAFWHGVLDALRLDKASFFQTHDQSIRSSRVFEIHAAS